jgi:hypothetical protein
MEFSDWSIETLGYNLEEQGTIRYNLGIRKR